MREPVPEPDRGGVARDELLQPPVLLHQLLEQLHVALSAVPRRRHPRLVDQPLVDEVDAVPVGAAAADADRRVAGVLHKPAMRSERPELARPAKRCLGALATIAWPWVPACGSLEPSRRGGENAQKTRNKRGRNGRDMV